MSTKNNNNHLAEEDLLGLIEGNLSKSDEEMITSHLQDCDQCFSRYSILFASHNETVDLEMEVTPDILVERAKRELDLIQPVKKFRTQLITNYVIDFLKGFRILLQPTLIPVTVISTGLVVLLIIYIFRTEPSPEREKQPVFDLTKRFQSRQLVPTVSSKIEGINVEVVGDTIKVSQPFKFKRELSVQTKDGITLLKTEFIDLENDIPFAMPIDQDSVILRITTLDTVVYEVLLSIQ